MKKNLLLVFVGLVVVFAGGLVLRHYFPDLRGPHIPLESESLNPSALEVADDEFLLSVGTIVLNFLSQGNVFALQEVVASEGLTFLPYPDDGALEKSQTFAVDVMYDTEFLALPEAVIWGTWDGRGDDMVLTAQEYYDNFIWDQNYLDAPEVFIGDEVVLFRGNTVVQLDEMFAGAKVIEYHFPFFEEEFAGLDWKSLYLVFVEENGGLFLRAIAHGQWTV